MSKSLSRGWIEGFSWKPPPGYVLRFGGPDTEWVLYDYYAGFEGSVSEPSVLANDDQLDMVFLTGFEIDAVALISPVASTSASSMYSFHFVIADKLGKSTQTRQAQSMVKYEKREAAFGRMSAEQKFAELEHRLNLLTEPGIAD